MLCTYFGNANHKPENYKDYRNRTFQKQLDKINNILFGIRQNSLKVEDKEKVRTQMIELIQNFKF